MPPTCVKQHNSGRRCRSNTLADKHQLHARLNWLLICLEAMIQLYTLAFFIMVSTILMNIIFGVIIDTFAELRARKVLDLIFLR